MKEIQVVAMNCNFGKKILNIIKETKFLGENFQSWKILVHIFWEEANFLIKSNVLRRNATSTFQGNIVNSEKTSTFPNPIFDFEQNSNF